MMKLIVLLLLSSFSSTLYAYAHFIGHGYTSCLNCHFNPLGGGAINDYGRAVSATAISSNALYPKSWDEEKAAYLSGFLFRKPKQEWLRTQISYRGFQLVRNPNSSVIEEKEWINMQADARVILKFGEFDKFIAVGSYGYAPLPDQAPPGKEQPEWRSRDHYVGYRHSPKIGVYAGLMDQAYGLRVIEHIAFSRSVPQVAQNDQVHGVLLHYLGELYEAALHGFAGNLTQEEDLRATGGSFFFERTIFDAHRVGASIKRTNNDYLQNVSYAAHGRFDLKKGSALLAEIGQTKRDTQNDTDDRTMTYGLLQTYLRPVRGVYFFTNIEYYQKDVGKEDYVVRWGPGVQYFPVQKLELRFDIYNTRNFDPSTSSPDVWMYLLQAHVWL